MGFHPRTDDDTNPISPSAANPVASPPDPGTDPPADDTENRCSTTTKTDLPTDPSSET